MEKGNLEGVALPLPTPYPWKTKCRRKLFLRENLLARLLTQILFCICLYWLLSPRWKILRKRTATKSMSCTMLPKGPILTTSRFAGRQAQLCYDLRSGTAFALTNSRRWRGWLGAATVPSTLCRAYCLAACTERSAHLKGAFVSHCRFFPATTVPSINLAEL